MKCLLSTTRTHCVMGLLGTGAQPGQHVKLSITDLRKLTVGAGPGWERSLRWELAGSALGLDESTAWLEQSEEGAGREVGEAASHRGL